MPPTVIVSLPKLINLTYLSELVAISSYIKRKVYKSIGLEPKTEMANISASYCPTCMILGLLELPLLARAI